MRQFLLTFKTQNADIWLMRRLIFKLCALSGALAIFVPPCVSQTKPLYKLPELPEKSRSAEAPFLVGTDGGLFKVLRNGTVTALWTEGKVSQIVYTGKKWFFSTDRGIIVSDDLLTFTEKNSGLPFLTVKTYSGRKKTLEKKAQLLKDLCVDPLDPDTLVTATKDAVYLTRDAGESWKSIGSMNTKTPGMKAVAVSHMPVYDAGGNITGSELVVFMSHPISGFSYYRADAAKPAWTDVSSGFAAMKSLTQHDELSDLLPVLCQSPEGTLYAELYAAQTFLPNIYRFNWREKKAEKIYEGPEKADTIDSLCQSNGNIIFATVGKLQSFSLESGTVQDLGGNYPRWVQFLNAPHALVNAAYVPPSYSELETPLQLSELWLLNPDLVLTPWGEKANHRKAIYVSAYQMRNMEGIEKYRKIIADNRLNALVVDMKDDYGFLRFEPKSPLLKEKGKVTSYKIDLDTFTREYKKDGTYLIGRIVVFKDKNLAGYAQGKYAVWDPGTRMPWMGIRGTEDVLDADGNPTGEKKTVYYDENWVDPYSEEVWEYNVEIAKELVERGFDEIQFDYIRFPTDGSNLWRAQYRWQDAGMDKESALMSFLAYARQNINAPIGIDIYGANGWYRSGTRTGQDVELMSEYVDVICPMYYPSHFEQDFMEYAPLEERPYRIYFYGSYRNTVIGRNRIVVRPWVQAFYMGVRYDRKYYDSNYVKREVFGVRDGTDRGYMHWNNSGRFYEDISPDPQDDEKSPWAQNETDLQKRIPAFSTGGQGGAGEAASKAGKISDVQMTHSQEMFSILDTVLNQGRAENRSIRAPSNLLHVEPLGVNVHD